MSDDQPPVTSEEEAYREYERKMILFEDGPTTTTFAQLEAAGIQLPSPDTVPERDIRSKLWEVLAALAKLRVYLDLTGHLSDRELYAKLWRDVLREEVPAIDEIGFNSHVDLCDCSSAEGTQLYLKYYADDHWRAEWVKEFPEDSLPAPEDPPYDRDCIVPRPTYECGPDAAEWLRANPSPHAFASNRFPTTQDAITFVERLCDIGATSVTVDNIMFLPGDNWLPYADTLIVSPPEGAARRRLFEFIEQDGAPDEDAGEAFADRGQSPVRLWWD
jgi:hypothetical protein